MGEASTPPVDLSGIRLVIRGPGKPDRDFDIEQGVYPIGSDRDNKIVLPGADISWRHAILSFLPDGFYVEDLGSESGTFLDGRRVSGRWPLRPGQEVRVGGYGLCVQGAGVCPPVPEAPAPPPLEPQRASEEPLGVLPDLTEEERSRANRAFLERKRAVKAQVQEELHKRLDIARLTASHIGEKDLHRRVRSALEQIIHEAQHNLPSEIAPADLMKEIYDEAVGLGPLEDLLADEEVTEIMVNGPGQVFVERKGRLFLTDKTFLNDQSVLAIIERIVAPIGRRIDESQPYVDARLPDGSRVNAIIAPLSLSGPCLTIRKFSREPFTVEDLARFGTLTADMSDFLEACVRLRKNIVVSGGTGSGKTTFLNVLSGFLPRTERIVTIEDAAELRLTQDHVVRLEARPPNIEGRGAVTIRDLVRNALRMRPDRIVVGECRGGEALDMLQAMNTGHEGSLTTVHANSPRDALSRLETMVLMSGMDLPLRAIREQIGAAIHLVVHTSRYGDGSRKVACITEVVGLEGDKVTMQDLFTFAQTATTESGGVVGAYAATGSVPTFMEEMRTRGIALRRNLFDPHAP